MSTSQNGWPVLQASSVRRWALPGTGRHLLLAQGSAGFVLAHFALWFHERVERLDNTTWDDWGYALRPIRGQTSGYSNHASGTAMDLNATKHPLGARNTFTLTQQRLLRGRLASNYDRVIRWGGDYVSRADEMHFEIVEKQPFVAALADHLRNSDRGRRVWDANGGDSG